MNGGGKFRSLAFALVASTALVACACGGSGRQPSSPTPEPSAATPANRSEAPPQPTSTARATPRPAVTCVDAPLRDSAGTLRLSFADPICADVLGRGVTVTLAATGDQTQTRPVEGTLIVAGEFSPYRRLPCATPYRLTLAFAKEGGTRPIGGAIVSCGVSPGVADCAAPGPIDGLAITGIAKTACLSWIDRYRDETGFRVEVTYPLMDLVYVYFVRAGTETFRLPLEAAPRLSESVEVCKMRKDFTISVVATFSGKADGPVGAQSFVAECGR